ncbi:hypothetical protein M569_12399, partial [Genlisea aurea]
AQTIPSPPGQKIGKSDGKSGGETTNAANDIFDSLYYKKERHRHKSADDLDSLFHEAQSFELPEGERSVIRNPDSSTQRKHRRTISVRINPASAPRPPPPSPPRMPSQSLASTTRTPPISKLNSSGEFQRSRIPPPPEPPSPSLLKTHVWKFVVKGDYVRINSDSDSASDSADPRESDSSNGSQFQQPPPSSPKSPDVNTKAESFITSFRAKLKLEKIDSMRKRELGP